MSKAFTKESEQPEDGDDNEAPELRIPKGSRNYITPEGAERLKAELKKLLYQERPEVVRIVQWAAGNGDRSENGDYIYGKRRLREIDRRIRFLSKRLETHEVVDPALQARENGDRVLFGATVTVSDEEGGKKIYQIVGIDESDPAHGKVSWISPIARALMNSRKGDCVTLRTPQGERELEIVEVRYV